MDDQLTPGWDSPESTRREGIFRHGFGIIPKFVMLDPALSITAKAIYAYLCACAGDGETSFPGRDTIVSRLSLTKDTYYKYLNELVDAGYVTVERSAPNRVDHGFLHNVYRLEPFPPRFVRQTAPSDRTVTLKGIRSSGYGMLSRSVMDSPEISVKAKALYAMLASFTGAGKCACPRISSLAHFMGVSRNTYQKLIRELQEQNLVTVTQRIVQGRLGVNEYELVECPDPAAAERDSRRKKVMSLPQSKRADRRSSPEHVRFSDVSESDIPVSDLRNPDMQEPDVPFSAAITNSVSNNSFTRNSPVNQQAGLCDEIDTMDQNEITQLVREKMGYDVVRLQYSAEQPYIDDLIQIVVDTISISSPTIYIAGSRRRREDVVNRLLSLNYEDYRHVLTCVSSSRRQVQNLRAYYLTCLYCAPADSSLRAKKDVEMYG